MYSNKIINAFLFFFYITLWFAPLISAGDSQLRQDYYETTCPGLNEFVWWGVWNATLSDPRVPASLLRLFFHDCFVNGCDASVLLDVKKGEQDAFPNKNSLRALEVIDNIKKHVDEYCDQPYTVSCADILALAAREGVKFALHADEHKNEIASSKYWYEPTQPWEVLLGRLDGMKSNMTGANTDIPSSTDPVKTIIAKFAAKGLSTQDMVVLSGAHTFGFTKCSTIKNTRLYSSSGNKTIDTTLLRDLQKKCPNDSNSDNNTVPLDGHTTYMFDNQYYINIMQKEGVLLSDQALGSDKSTSGWVEEYAKEGSSGFLNNFGAAMVRMGNTGVITKGSAIKGEIRKKCGSTN